MNGTRNEIVSKPISDSIAEEFSTSKAYAVGDMVMREGTLYKFTAAHTAGAWNAGHVTTASVDSEIGEVKDALDNLDIETDTTLSVSGKPADSKTVGDEIAQLENDLNAVSDNERIDFTQGKFLALNGTTVDVSDLRTGTNNSVAVVSCNEGDTFTISAQGGSSSRAWGFVDASTNVIEKADASISVNKMVVTAPINAAYLVINDTLNSGRASYKGIVLKSKTNKVIDDTQILYSSLMEQGGLDTVKNNPPILVDSATIIRTKNYSAWSSNTFVSLKPGYEGRLLVCDASGNFLAVNGWGNNLIKTGVTGGALAKVAVRKTDGTNITPDEIHNCYEYSDIPLENINSKADEFKFNELKDIVDTIDGRTGRYTSTVSLNTFDGVMSISGAVTSGVGIHASVSVNGGDIFELIAQKGNASYPAYLFFKGSTLVSYGDTVPTGGYRAYTITVPSGVDTLIINSLDTNMIRLVQMIKSESAPKSHWIGKKIVWFGTSIPARSGYNPYIGYPEYVASQLGATVYNEAVPSSMARGGARSVISENDPYGWTGIGYVAAIRNMGSTIAEKQNMIDNWESKWKALVGGNHTLTDEEKTFALSCSYENKLVPYIDTNPVDLYVFDHGFNDWSANNINMDLDESNPYNMATFFGAMNKYISLIFQSNPRARIVMISHYETDERPGLIQVQENIAKYWNIPFFKLYDKLGWCYSRKVKSYGHWKLTTGGHGVWINSGTELTEYRLTQLHIPDGRHPNLDLSGNAIRDIGEAIIPFINEIAPAN